MFFFFLWKLYFPAVTRRYMRRNLLFRARIPDNQTTSGFMKYSITMWTVVKRLDIVLPSKNLPFQWNCA